MALKCKIGLHSWNGCKCSECEKTRDEQHDWSKDCEKCSKCGKTNENQHDYSNDCDKCSKCNKSRENQHDWSTNCTECSKCGKTRPNQHFWTEDNTKCSKCGEQSGIKIGKQIWMSKNLNVSYFQNGDLIPEAKTEKQWENAEYNSKPAWCYYNNDPSNGEEYGKLYNWYAVNDPRGLSPKGYHVASLSEWEKLFSFLGGRDKAAKKMISNKGWKLKVNVEQSCGFSALPGGNRTKSTGDSKFHNLGSQCYWWTSTDCEKYKGNAYDINIGPTWYGGKSYSEILIPVDTSSGKGCGFSVRCVLDKINKR